MRILLPAVVMMIAVTSCATPPDIPLTVSFDEVAGYVDDSSITHLFAHSGNTSVFVSETVPHSLEWKSSCDQLPWRWNNRITINGWARTGSKDGSALLMVSFSDSTKTRISWDSVQLDRTLLKNDLWTSFEKSFVIPSEFTGKDSVRIFLMNAGKGVVYLDDLVISNH